MNGPETGLAHFVSQIEPIITYAQVFGAGVSFLCTLFYNAKVTHTVLIFRHLSMVGMLSIFCGLWIPSLGLLGNLLYWPAFAIGTALAIAQNWRNEVHSDPKHPAPEQLLMAALIRRYYPEKKS